MCPGLGAFQKVWDSPGSSDGTGREGKLQVLVVSMVTRNCLSCEQFYLWYMSALPLLMSPWAGEGMYTDSSPLYPGSMSQHSVSCRDSRVAGGSSRGSSFLRISRKHISPACFLVLKTAANMVQGDKEPTAPQGTFIPQFLGVDRFLWGFHFLLLSALKKPRMERRTVLEERAGAGVEKQNFNNKVKGSQDILKLPYLNYFNREH